jgi:acetylornithine deacetylase
MNPFELCTDMMKIPSITGNEGAMGEFLVRLLGEKGYAVRTQEVEPGRRNVLADTDGAQVILCTHIDTVPPVLEVREDEAALYGRGACDTKGIIAAMLEAGERLKAEGTTGFGYLFLVGEETGGDGAKAANTLDWNSKYVVVGEPTDNQMARAQKGTLMAEIRITGQAAHSGYPDAGRSAIHPLVGVLSDLIAADWGTDPVLGTATCNVGVIEGGEKPNILAAEARAGVMLRTITAPEESIRRLESVVDGRARVTIQAAAAPQFMLTLDGFPDAVVSFGSDVPYLGSLGKPLLIGPGSILDAHTSGEKIFKKDLMEGVDLYSRIVRQLVGAAA